MVAARQRPVRLFARFLAASGPRKRLVLTSLVLVPGIRVALRRRPFSRVLAFVGTGEPTEPSRFWQWYLRGAAPEDVSWAVARVGDRFRMDGPCLTLALTAIFHYRRMLVPADLRIGVLRDKPGELTAHAWVERDGQVVVGQLDDLDRYLPLPSFDQVPG